MGRGRKVFTLWADVIGAASRCKSREVYYSRSGWKKKRGMEKPLGMVLTSFGLHSTHRSPAGIQCWRLHHYGLLSSRLLVEVVHVKPLSIFDLFDRFQPLMYLLSASCNSNTIR